MLLPSYAIEVAAVAGLLILILLRWRYERACLTRFLAQTSCVPELELIVTETPLDQESRGHRAMALMCAAVVWRGDPTDTEGMLSVADEFLQYIEGDNSVMPRPDKLVGGKLPKAKK
jgi:hypothetical protein